MEDPKTTVTAPPKLDAYQIATTVEDALAYLTSSQVRNFYATIINSLERVAAPGFKTMGVAAHRGRYILCYDPEFVANTNNRQLMIVLEHEVLHIILHHIPRYLRLRKLHDTGIEQALFELCANTGMDLADNALLRGNYPDIATDMGKEYQPILPESFDPPMPRELDYENYHRLLLKMFKERLKTSATELYKQAKQALEKQQQALQDALNQAYPPPPSQPPADKKDGDPQPGDGTPQQSQQEQTPGQGQGSGPGQPQSGQGQGGGSDNTEQQDQQGEPQKLDPVDQLALELLMRAMAQHMAWGAAADMNSKESQEADPHKLEEHGRQLVRDAARNAQKSRGTVPSSIAELIAKMLLPPTVPWTQFLHNIIQQTRQTKKIRGMSRPSKKLSAFKIFAHVSEKNDRETTDTTN